MNYFDHAASSGLYPEVLEILQKSLQEDFANPSSQHILGHTLFEKINQARSEFLKVLGAHKEDSFYFTSSATESNNTVIKGLSFHEGDVILYSKADHPSLTAPIEQLASILKIELKEIPLNSDGTINIEYFQNALDKNIKLVALTHVNNQSGVIQDIGLLSKLVKEYTNAHVHVDAVQAFGKIKVALNPHIDSLSITSHKIGGPKGVAGLFLKRGTKVNPLLLGGGQEQGFRSSTQAFPLIIAFHKAMKISLANLDESLLRVAALREIIQAQITQSIPPLLSPFKSTSPYIFSFVLPGISSDIILRHLEMRDVFISSTSACSSKISGFNPSLFALGIPEQFHKNFLRISLSPVTTEKEVENLVCGFQKVWGDLKHLKGK